MDKSDIASADKTLREAGFDPDRPVSLMSVRQLYLLVRFAVGRTINHMDL